MIGDDGAGADTFVQAEVFRRMPCVEGVDLRFDALTVAARMDLVADIEQMKRGQSSGCVADSVIGGMRRFGTQIVARGARKRCVADARDLGHFSQPHVGAHRDHAGEDFARVGVVLHIAIKHVSKRLQKISAFGDEP
ncbi:hypothetical protein SBC1_78440 (plasmid) [Caballeronia sp. SBC1]|nr:hypothetical protein SBC1_78440 [Caballeronia sp. SBC1]